MNEVYWYQGKQLPLEKNNLPLVLKQLKVPKTAISEIHYVTHHQLDPIDIPDLPVKYWQVTESIFDLILLLINRLQAADLESILILEDNPTHLSYALFGKPTIVGKFNLPPEFEIKNSGWVSPSIFNEWLRKSETPPILISINELSEPTNLKEKDLESTSILDAFIKSKNLTQTDLPIIFKSEFNQSISYLIVERI